MLCRRVHVALLPSRPGSEALHLGRRHGFFSELSKAAKAAATSNGSSSATAKCGKGDGGVPPGLPPGIDLHRLHTMQDLFNSQPPEKQKQLMEGALAFQKIVGKIPGLGTVNEKNLEMMQQLMKTQEAEVQKGCPARTTTPPNRSFRGTTVSNNTATQRANLFQSAASTVSPTRKPSGPTLDDLQNVNLGPEIEALFAELKTIRATKNEYRDQCERAESRSAQLQKENTELRATEQSIRQKLRKMEQDAMLLTTENLRVNEEVAEVRRLEATNQKLSQELTSLRSQQAGGTAAGTPTYTALQQQLQAKESALRSLQRKVDRVRRRDPLLHFSLACNAVGRLCDPAHDPCKDSAEDAFTELQTAFHDALKESWEAIFSTNGAGSRAYVAVVGRLLQSVLPCSAYDSMLTVTGDRKAATAAFEAVGFTVTVGADAIGKERLYVAAPGTGPLQGTSPYSYAVALQTASAAKTAHQSDCSTLFPFSVSTVQPHISDALLNNAARAEVTFESARASGPGGQATNVAETQIYAKLTIDGRPAYTAEAQDSRSALQNRELALEKLHGARRAQHLDSLARHGRSEEVDRFMVARLQKAGGLQVEQGILHAVGMAVGEGQLPVLDGSLVWALQAWAEAAAQQPVS